MICSASQIDSFWKTFVLSNDCESSMRAIVIEPPRFGLPVVAGEPPLEFEPVSPPSCRSPRPPRPRTGRGAGCLRTRMVLLQGERWRRRCALYTTHRPRCHATSTCSSATPSDRRATSRSRGRWPTGWRSGSSAARARPGERLTEPRLAELAGRQPLARCGRRCESWQGEGLVEITPRHGAQVAQRRGRATSRELYECRLLLEPRCAYESRSRRSRRTAWPSSTPIRGGDGGGRGGRRAALPGRERRLLPARSPGTARTRLLREFVELTWNERAALLEHLRARRRLQHGLAHSCARRAARGGAGAATRRPREARRPRDPGARAERSLLSTFERRNERYVVVGAGAIGGTVGARLARGGHSRAAVRRRRRPRRGDQRGRAHGSKGRSSSSRCGAGGRPRRAAGRLGRRAAGGQVAAHARRRSQAIAPRLAPDGFVVSLQNGINEPLIAVGRRARSERSARSSTSAPTTSSRAASSSAAAARSTSASSTATAPRGSSGCCGTCRTRRRRRTSSVSSGRRRRTAPCCSRPRSPISRSPTRWPSRATAACSCSSRARCWRPRRSPVEAFDGFDADDLEGSIERLVAFNRRSAKTHSGIYRDLMVRRRPTEKAMLAGHRRAAAAADARADRRDRGGQAHVRGREPRAARRLSAAAGARRPR